MKNKWAVVVVERESEDISTVIIKDSEKEAQDTMRELWKRDIGEEAKEAAFPIDFCNSKCEDDFAELYYIGKDCPIKYFVVEVSDGKIKLSETVVNNEVEIFKKKYKIGQKFAKIEWNEKRVKDFKMKMCNAEIIAISPEGKNIGIINDDNNLANISIDKIFNVVEE